MNNSIYCHVSGAPWLIITGSGLDDWIYWQLLLQSLLITLIYKNSQSVFCRGLAPFSSSFSVYNWLFSLLYSVVRPCIPILLTLVLPQQFSYNFRTPISNSLIPQLQTDCRYTASGRTPLKIRVTCYQECEFIGSLPSTGHGIDHTENTSVIVAKCLVCAA
jgi:hypothetical protein